VTASSEVDLPPQAPPVSRRRRARRNLMKTPLRMFRALLGRRWVQPVIVIVGIALLAVAYYLQARTLATISEGSSQALQAWSMWHGNWLLTGWSLSDVSFYTTELPEYVLVEFFRGLNTWTIPTAAAISYFLQVVLAGFLAKGRATGREGWVRALIAVAIMLAPPLGAPTALLMGSPDHVGTHVPLLLIFLVLDRVRPRWWLPIVTMVMLTWATVGDPLVIYEGAVPIAAVCLVRMYRRRGPLSAQWYDLSLAVGALLSAGVARVIIKVIADHNGFYVRTPVAAFGTPGQIQALFWTKVGNLLLVYGADFFGDTFGHTAVVALIHLIGAVLVFWALAAAIRRFYVDNDQIVQMFTVAFIIVLVAYVLGTKPDSNEIVGLLPIGAVLAGRVLGSKVLKAGLGPAIAAFVTACAVMLAGNAMAPSQVNVNEKVAVWLQQHHLKYGLAGFWNASSVTVETGNAVQVRPVRTYQDSVVTTNFQSDSTWYDPTHHYANFVIWTLNNFCGDICLTRAGLRSLGQPARTVIVGDYVVMIYHRNLLPITEVTWCGPAWVWKAKGVPTTNLHCTGVAASTTTSAPPGT
jgi:uncharacterized membrane protein YwzB